MAYAIEVATSSPRAGRRFEPVQERELHADAWKAVRDLPGARRGLVVVPEFAGPIGIPDFTAYVGPVERIRRRQVLTVEPVVNEIEAGIVAAVRTGRPLSGEGIARALDWPAPIVTERLRKLVRRGMLLETTPDRFTRPRELEPGGRIYAVEAKVDDWRAALRQVRTYRVWADSYVLVMAKLSDKAQDALVNEVRRDGGGLMLQGTWIVRPLLGHSLGRRRLQAWELFAAATREGLGSPSLAPGVHSQPLLL